MITPSLIRDSASLAAIEPEWRLLWERCPDATPFQHPPGSCPGVVRFIRPSREAGWGLSVGDAGR